VEATLRAHQEQWLTVEIRVCPPTLLGQVRKAFPCSPAAVPWLSRLQAIAEDPTESLRGLLGHFSSTQMDFIESLFVLMGEPDPWGSIINPIWAAHLADVEKAWDRATEPNPDLTSGEPPISPQLYQTEAPLEDVLVSPQLVESLVRVLAPPPPEEPPESVPVVTLPGDRRRVLVEEAPSEGEVLSPLKLLFREVAVFGSFPLKFLFPFLPSWSRSKWWTVFSRHAFQVLCRAPRSTLADPPPGVSSILLPLRYKVMTSLCGPLVGSSSPRGSTRVPFYLAGDVVGV